MFSCVCILHSCSASYNASLLTQAAHAAAAVFHTVRAASPDFAPSIAVLRANPAEGVQYAYSSCAREAPHDGDAADATPQSSAFADSFLAVSADPLRRAVLRTAAPAESKVSARPGGCGWHCLAGALLAACCFLRGRGGGGGCGILVFSDARDMGPPAFAADCALSAATVAAVRLRASVSVFGSATAGAHAGGRLRAIAHATGGVCAEAFALPHVAAVLDSSAPEDSEPNGAETDSAEPGAGEQLPRRLRERLVEQYVVAPANLPGDVGSAAVGSAANVSHLAWLCPTCMAPIVRSMQGTENVAKSCPFCCERANGGAIHEVGGVQNELHSLSHKEK